MAKEDENFFSIVVLLSKAPHLIRYTLESILSQNFTSYEVLLIAQKSTQQLIDIPEGLTEKVRLFRLRDTTNGQLMNRGVDKSKGKYIHFLESGDTYMTSNSLEEISMLLKEKPVDLFYSAYIKREENSMYAVYKPFSYRALKQGKLYTHLESCVFLKKSLISKGKIHSKLTYQPGLEIFLRFFLDDKMTHFFIKKVYCDHEIKRKSPGEVFHEVVEIFWILNKHLGIFQALKWWLFQDYFRVYQWTKRMLKKAFFRT